MNRLRPNLLSQLNPSDIRFRLLGVFPLLFFLAQAVHYWKINELGHVLWMCNIGNLVLALGLFLNLPLLIRIAVIWMVPGLVVWLVYVVLAWGVFLTSTLAHAGGIAIGMLALSRIKMGRWDWLYALGWYFIVQFLSYLITPASLNVNVAHAIAPGWEQTFSSYWKFWLVLCAVTIALLWTINLLLYKLWPASSRDTVNA